MDEAWNAPSDQNDQVDDSKSSSNSKRKNRKRDRDNWNCVQYKDLIHDWSQNGNKVTVTVQVGPGHNAKSVEVSYDEKQLSVGLHDGRKFQVSLYDCIVPEETKVTFKSHSCIVHLTKANSTDWNSLEAQIMKAPSTIKPKVDESTPAMTPPKSFPFPIDKAEFKLSKNSSDDELELFEEGDLIEVLNPKTNFCEHTGERNMAVFLYIKAIIKETLVVHFSEDKVFVRFSSSDSGFLQNYTDATNDSRFCWSLKLKGVIIPEQCSFKLGLANLEIKLKKRDVHTWSTLSPTSNGNSEITKNIWVNAGAISKASPKKQSDIPPAPPAPPLFHEKRKPTTLVSPSKPRAASSLGTGSSFSVPSSSLDRNSSINFSNKGLTGLENIGNTCFMNSVLQCLINTRELKEYFESNFQDDINKDNPLGMGGKVAASFAMLMDLVWKGTVRSHAPTKLKNIMSIKANQFSGYAQHDAQEFMVELLDGLHEDLNRVKKKPYIAEPPDLDGYPDPEAADTSWKLHKSRNDSIVDDLFKGQFKSTLKCHICGKISVKFDEFCCLSVPIPKDQKLIQIILFWVDGRKPKKFVIRLPADSHVEDLKAQLSLRTGIRSSCIQILEASKSKIQKIFIKGASLSNVSANDVLMAFEIADELKHDGPILQLAVTQRMLTPSAPSLCASCNRPPGPGKKLKRCTKCYRAGYCNTSCQKNHWPNHKIHCRLVPELVGSPFIISLPESEATYANLSRAAQNYARYSVDIFQPPVSQTQIVQRRQRRRRGSNSSGETSSEGEEMDVDSEGSGETKETQMDARSYSGEDRAESDWPFFCSTNEDANGAGNEGENVVYTSRTRRHSSISSTSSCGEDLPQLSSSPGIRNAPQKMLSPAPLLFSLKLMSSRVQNLMAPAGESLVDKGDEPLNLGDTQHLLMEWETSERRPVFCFIQNKEIECDVEEEENNSKSRHTSLDACIDLFTQPENLSEGDSWRCPRCKKPVEATKQMSIWRLPTILIVQLKRFSFKYILYSDKIDKFVQYPIRGLDLRPYMSQEPTDGPALYDLYGVINHMGRLLGGHYNAYCRTVDLEDSQKSLIDWRLCDDSRVNFVNESRVVHDQAYLLLYRRRGIPFSLTYPPSISLESSHKGDEQKDDCCHGDQNSDSITETSVGSQNESDEHPEPMEGATPMSISSISQFSSSSDPPSTLQEELD